MAHTLWAGVTDLEAEGACPDRHSGTLPGDALGLRRIGDDGEGVCGGDEVGDGAHEPRGELAVRRDVRDGADCHGRCCRIVLLVGIGGDAAVGVAPGPIEAVHLHERIRCGGHLHRDLHRHDLDGVRRVVELDRPHVDGVGVSAHQTAAAAHGVVYTHCGGFHDGGGAVALAASSGNHHESGQTEARQDVKAVLHLDPPGSGVTENFLIRLPFNYSALALSNATQSGSFRSNFLNESSTLDDF